MTIAEQVVLALRGDFVPFAVNVAASEVSETVRPFLPLAERLGRLFTGLAGGAPETLEITYEGEIADYDCRVLTLSVLKGVLGPVSDEPVTFVNAPQLAEERKIAIRETTSSDRARLRQPDLRARRGRHARRGDALREAGSAAHRRHRRADDRPAAVAPLADRQQRGRPGCDRSGRHDPRRRRHQHLRLPRRPEPERRGRADGHRHRLARVRPRSCASSWTNPACARHARSISSSDVAAASALRLAEAVGSWPHPRRRSNGPRGCGRSSGRRARGRCRSTASP